MRPRAFRDIGLGGKLGSAMRRVQVLVQISGLRKGGPGNEADGAQTRQLGTFSDMGGGPPMATGHRLPSCQGGGENMCVSDLIGA